MPPRWFRADLLAESLPQSANAASDAQDHHHHHDDLDDDEYAAVVAMRQQRNEDEAAARHCIQIHAEGSSTEQRQQQQPNDADETATTTLPVDTGVDARGRASRRRVRFRASAYVHPAHKYDYALSPSSERAEASWHSESDLKRMQQDTIVEILAHRVAAAAAAAAAAGNDNKTKKVPKGGLCIRGIEHLRDPLELKARERAKMRCIEAVLRRQEELRRRRECHHPAKVEETEAELARVSVKHSAKAKQLASLLGRGDEEWANKMRKKDAANANAKKKGAASRRSDSSSKKKKSHASKRSKSGMNGVSSDRVLSRVRGILDDCHLSSQPVTTAGGEQ